MLFKVLIKRGKFNSPIFRWGGTALLLLMGFACFGNQGLRKLYELRRLENRLEKQLRLLASENERLVEEIEQLGDPKVLETIIRNDLGYLRSDETIFFIETRGSHPH